LQARYEKGAPPLLIHTENGFKLNVFNCEEGEFVQYISGGFSSDFLDYLVFVTNFKRLVKYGVELATSTKFDFNIGDKEYPSALFGEVTQTVQGYRLNRIGCFIEALAKEHNEGSSSKSHSLIRTESNKPINEKASDSVEIAQE